MPLSMFVLDQVMRPFGICNWSLLVFLGWSTSSPLSSKEFDLELKLVSNNIKSATLKATLTAYSPGRSIFYALSMILSKTWSWPSPRGCNFDFLWLGNRSLCMCTQTQSPGWRTTCLRPLFALEALVCSFSLFIVELPREVVSPSLPSFHHLNLSFLQKVKELSP